MFHRLHRRQSSFSLSLPETRLLADDFNGVAGTSLINHEPDTVHTWDTWQQADNSSSASAAFQLDGNGYVANTTTQTAGEGGTRSFFTYMRAATSDPVVSGIVLTPVSGAFILGFIFRMSNTTTYWAFQLNSTNHLLEIVQVSSGSDTVRASVDMGSLSLNTEYPMEVECVGTSLVARCNGFTCSFTSSTNQTETRIGIRERVTSGAAHGKFGSISVAPSANAGILASRIFHAAAAAVPLQEFDDVTNSGIADTTRETSVIAAGVFASQITANGTQSPASGTRCMFQFDSSGKVPTTQSAFNVWNMPTEAYYTAYYWIPSIQRVGTFWNIFQWKQRDSSNATSPVYSLNLGWDGTHKITEINSNMHADGSYNADEPDLSTENFIFPDSQWVRIDAYYRWSPTNGRVTFWMDNMLIYDYDGIQTQFTTGQNWSAPQNPRQWSVNHYAANLSPNISKIWHKNEAISVAGRLPDEYPTLAPV